MTLKGNKILIVNPFGIGDVLFTTPVIRAIKEAYPESEIAYWCNERVKDLFRNSPNIYKVFPLSRGDLKKRYRKSFIKGTQSFFELVGAIKKERFDCLLDFSLDHRYSLIAKFLGIKRRIGFNYKNRGRFLTDKIDITGYSRKHIVSYYSDVLKFLNVKEETVSLDLFITDADRNAAKNLLFKFGAKEEDYLIAVAPGAGASWGADAKFKHWPAQNFAKLIDRITTELKAKVVLLGDISERQISATIKSCCDANFIDMVGETDLSQLIGVINNCRILITNDGGPLHIAVAAGIKSVSIFGPVDENVYGPYPASSKHIVIKNTVACRPCYRNFKFSICQIGRECLDAITVDEVFDATRRLM